MKRRALIFVLIVSVLAGAILTGCSKSSSDSGDKASVQEVSMITQAGNTGVYDRYAGEVVSQNTVEFKKDDSKTVKTVYVAEGDSVAKGDRLFTYDVDSIQLTLDKARLDLEQLQNNISNYNSQISQLQSDKSKAAASEQLNYSVQIQSVQADLSEAQYNAKLKEEEVARLQDSVDNPDVVSTVDGVIKVLNKDLLSTSSSSGTSSSGTAAQSSGTASSQTFITIMETGNFRVKGYINELAAKSLSQGTKVVIRSRADDKTWTGEIQKIDWDNPVSTGNTSGSTDGVSASSSGSATSVTSSSKYPFYVTIESTDGMMLGQHVYVEPDNGQTAKKEGLYLPSYYINDIDGSPWVWAADSKDKLEKRSVTLGEHDAALDSYEIKDGLTEKDHIAFPDDTLTEGMAVSYYDETSAGSTGAASSDGAASSGSTGADAAAEGSTGAAGGGEG